MRCTATAIKKETGEFFSYVFYRLRGFSLLLMPSFVKSISAIFIKDERNCCRAEMMLT